MATTTTWRLRPSPARPWGTAAATELGHEAHQLVTLAAEFLVHPRDGFLEALDRDGHRVGATLGVRQRSDGRLVHLDRESREPLVDLLERGREQGLVLDALVFRNEQLRDGPNQPCDRQ